MKTRNLFVGLMLGLHSLAAGIIPAVVTLAAGALLVPVTASAQISSAGNDFIVGFLQNFDATGTVELHLTSPVGMQVQVEYPVGTNLGAPVTLTPGNVSVVTIPITAASGWTASTLSTNAVRASSVNPAQRFTCYMINRRPHSSDAGLALPINALGNFYRVISATPTIVGVGSEFVVVATQNGTSVTITPSQAIPGHAAGVPFTVTLNRGEGWFAQSTPIGPTGDLTGSTVQSSLPVSVTEGVGCVNIGCGACDHVFEVAQPVQTWGTGIPAADLPGFAASGVSYRIMAANTNTTVLQDGVSIGVLNAGEFLTTPQLTGSHFFDGDQAGSPQPIFVVQLMPGCASEICASGDPSIGNIIPAAQYQSAYTFSTVGSNQFACNFVTIIATNADVGTLTLDGVAVASGSFTAIGASGFSSALIPVTSGVHQTASANPHGLTVEGYNDTDSYLYPGGALLNPINVDLVLTKDDQVTDCVAIGGTINYKVCYQNKGKDPANNVLIVDTLPSEVDFVSASGGGVYNSGPRTVTWSVGTVPSNMPAAVCFDLSVTVSNTATAGGEIVNGVSIDSDETDLTLIQKRTAVCTNQLPVAQISCAVQFFTTNGVAITTDLCGAAGAGVPSGTAVLVGVEMCANAGNSGPVSNLQYHLSMDGISVFDCGIGTSLVPGDCTGCQFYPFTCTNAGLHTFTATATAQDNCSDCVTTACTNTLECCGSCTNLTTLVCPDPIVTNTAPGRCDAVVTFTPQLISCDTNLFTVCFPPSGSTFPVGTTNVVCEILGTDNHFAIVRLGAGTFDGSLFPPCTFPVTVQDKEPPLISCPANITQPNDPERCDAVVTFTTTATDNCGPVTIRCWPCSGTTFPVGTTPVNCTATDGAGNKTNCTFAVTVQDTEKPAIHCPGNLTQPSDPGRCDAVVTFKVTAQDNCGTVTVACWPSSGSAFPQGTTLVRCSATDAATNTAWCSFNVTVNQPASCGITANPGLTICQGRTVILTAPNGMKSYLWHGPERDGATVQTIVVGTPGTYTCTQQAYYGATNCCSVTVVVNPLPLCTISGGPNAAPSAPATLCGPDGMAGYVWLSGPQFAGSTSQCITVTVAGTYSLRITDTNGCQATCNTTLTNNVPQPCFITGNLSICKGSKTILTAPNGMIYYAWTGPSNFVSSAQFIIVGTAGQYTVTQVDGHHRTNTCSATLVVNEPPPCAITGARICCADGSTTLCGPTGLLRQYWLGPQNNGLNTVCNTVSTPGSYTLVMTDSNGCQRACTVQVWKRECDQ